MTIQLQEGKISWKYILIGVVLLSLIVFVFVFLLPLAGAGNESPNVAVDNDGNLHIVWVSGNESSYEQDLYYKKLDSKGKTLINTTKLGRIERLLDGPEIVVDLKNNVHIFTGIEVLKSSKEGMIIQHLIVNNGNVLFKREIKSGDEAREPAVAIDSEDNACLIYSVWNAKKDERGITRDWDIRYYFEKIDSKGKILTGPVEIEDLAFPDVNDVVIPYGRKIIAHNDKLYFAIGLIDYDSEQRTKFKYAEIDKDGKLIRILDSPVEYFVDRYIYDKSSGKEPLPVLADDPSHLCFSDSCTVDNNNNVYYFYSLKNRESHRCYLKYRKFDQTGKILEEGKITEFVKGPFYWIFDPVIFDIRSYIDKNDNSNITYYINNGFNNFSAFYSKIDTEGRILIERLKIR